MSFLSQEGLFFWELTDMGRQKPIMETEITKLRQEVFQLRAQLSSAQLSSLDYDGPSFPQRQHRLSAETLHQQKSSPITTVTATDDHKRKAENTVDDPSSRAREFRREMNKRQAMPPPALPQRIEQQHPDTTEGERYYEQRHDLNRARNVDTRPGGYSNQFQQLDYSPQQQQIYEDQQVFRETPNGQPAYQGNQEHQFIDLTSSVGSSVSPSNPRGRFTQQQQQHDTSQSRSGFVNNINIPFRSPIRTPTTRPINSPLVRGLGDEYFSSPNRPPPRTGTGYGNLPSPLRAGGNIFHPQVSLAEHMPLLTRQGGNINYPYERGGQLQSTIPNKGGGSVVSPFFSDPPTPPKNTRLSAIDGGIRRPASVAGFTGRYGGLSRSHGGGLGNGGFFGRQDDVAKGIAVTTEVPNWNTPISAVGRGGSFVGDGGGNRPGTVGGFGGSRGDMFGPQRGGRSELGGIFGSGVGGAAGGGVVDRPGLRRSVRRD